MTTPIPRSDLADLHGGEPPSVFVGEGPHYWTMHRAHASVRYCTYDRGATWHKVAVTWAAERNRHDMEAIEQASIQRDLK